MKKYTLIATLLAIPNTTTASMTSTKLRALAASVHRAFNTMPAIQYEIYEIKEHIKDLTASQKELRAKYEVEEKARRETIVNLQRTIGELSREPQNAQKKATLAVLHKRLAGIAQLHDKSALHFARVNRSYEETLTRFESRLSDQL